MKRTFLGALLFSFSLSYATAQQTREVDATYHFTTLQTDRGMQEAATIIRTVAQLPQVSVDLGHATLTFRGPAEETDLAAWILPQIDRASGDTAVHEYKLASGDVARVNFVPNIQTPQEQQEALTVLRTVADIRKIFNFSANQAFVLRGRDYEIAFAEWIIDQLNQPPGQKRDGTPREFTVGGPDLRGHAARVNILTNINTPRGMQEILTVLRTVGDIQKVFNYTAGSALVLRGPDDDVERAEWLIQQLNQPPVTSAGGALTFAAPTGDDVTRVFRLTNGTPEGLRAAVSGIRSELRIRRVFATTAPGTVVIRGTSGEIGAAAQWLASHNGLAD